MESRKLKLILSKEERKWTINVFKFLTILFYIWIKNVKNTFTYYLDEYNKNKHSSEILFALANKYKEKNEIDKAISLYKQLLNSSNVSKSDYDNSKYSLAILSIQKNNTALILEYLNENPYSNNVEIAVFELINYYKSCFHLTGLYKYNSNIFPEIIFIFNNSPKLTYLLNKNNFLIESLVYLFNYGLPNFQIREKSDNFDLDLKKIQLELHQLVQMSLELVVFHLYLYHHLLD